MSYTIIADNHQERKLISQDNSHYPEFDHAEKVNPNISEGYRSLNFYELPNGATRLAYVKNRSIHQGITDSIQAGEYGKKKGTGLPGVSLHTQKKLQKAWQLKDFPFTDDVHYFSIGLSQPSKKKMQQLGLTVHDYISKDEWSEALKAAHRSIERKMPLLDFLHVIEFTHSYAGWNNVIHSGGIIIVKRPDDMSVTEMEDIIYKAFRGLLIKKNPRVNSLLQEQGAVTYNNTLQKSWSCKEISQDPANLGQSINNKIVYTTTKAATKDSRSITQKYYDVESGQVHEGGKTYFMQKRNGIPPKEPVRIPPILDDLLTDDDVEMVLLGMQMDVVEPGASDERRYSVATDSMNAKDAVAFFLDVVREMLPEKWQEYKDLSKKQLWGDYFKNKEEKQMEDSMNKKEDGDQDIQVIWQSHNGTEGRSRTRRPRTRRYPSNHQYIWRVRE